MSLFGPAGRSVVERLVPGLVVAVLLVVAGSRLFFSRSAAEEAHIIPPPAIAEQAGTEPTEVAVLAGGCFWGVQGVFQHVKGVASAVSGYAGGDRKTAHYETVYSGGTGHAESVRITYDPRQISYGRILQIFFSVAHNPTELNRQGPDFGPQYRSAIFPANAEQARVARAYIAELNQAHAFDAAIVTKIEPGKEFFPAEDYHQDYMTLHPRSLYIVDNDLPKVDDLQRIFPDLYRADPVLVTATRQSD